MFGQPVADIAEAIGMARQIDAVAQRRGGFCACGDDREVEDRERNYGGKLVCIVGCTKGLGAQIRRASAGTGDGGSDT